MYLALPKSYKGMFPFKIGTTSFIYPDSYVQNVQMLAPYLDEIELILFESAPDSRPSNDEINTLLSLGNEYDITYNIHLPLDIFLGAPDPSIRHFAVETIKQIIDLTAPLSPSTFTLHLAYDETDMESEPMKRWRNRTYTSIHKLISSGINGKKISIETLNYPIEWVEEILIDFNLSVCLDLGHLILHGFDMDAVFKKYQQKTSIIHLHGANHRRDHRALDLLAKPNLETILDMLKRFKGVVSIEVFAYDHLNASLTYLESVWMKHEV
jgi:sugar phosphate isomerase/epimerase